jgi:hypothetical protein
MFVRFCIICPIAKSQIVISKKASPAARAFIPFETVIIRIVPRETSQIRAIQIREGMIT